MDRAMARHLRTEIPKGTATHVLDSSRTDKDDVATWPVAFVSATYDCSRNAGSRAV